MDPERWKQVEGIFHSVLDRPGSDRDELLRKACAGDPELEDKVRLELARSLAAVGETQKAHTAFGGAINLWKNADPALQPVQAARAESLRLR